jgi:hypothetical protein
VSLFDEARAQQKKLLAEQAKRVTPTPQIMDQYFKNLEEVLYQELRDKAVEIYRMNYKIENLDYSKSWLLSSSITSCNDSVIKQDLERAMETAFRRLCTEIKGQKNLRRYCRRSGWGNQIWIDKGYRIFATHSDYGVNGEDISSYSFQVTLFSRFTPPLTG